MTRILFILYLCSAQIILFAEPPTEQKLRISFFILEQNLSLNNRTNADVQQNESFLPLAENCVDSALKFYPDSIDLILASIRTLMVEGNFYLRTEKFIKAHQKLMAGKSLCDQFQDRLEEKTPLEICESLSKISNALPAIYSLVLHHLGQIPLYYSEAPGGMQQAEKYLKLSLEIRQVIDSNPQWLKNIPDNNTVVGDAVIFKRTLGYVYLQTNRLEEAEKLYTELLTNQDSFNLLISHRQLLKIYQRKGQLTLNQTDRKTYYLQAIQSAQACLKLIGDDIGNFFRVASIYKNIGNLYLDEKNPFQDIEESYKILQLAKLHCPDQLTATSEFVHKELGDALRKLSHRELVQAEHLHLTIMERENIDSLKIMPDEKAHVQNYINLGDVYRRKKSFVPASAFYSNGLSLASKNPHFLVLKDLFWQKLALTESQFLKHHEKNFEPIDPSEYKLLLSNYKISLEKLRNDTKYLINNNIPVESIYVEVNKKYKQLIGSMLLDLMDYFGPPPTADFAVIAFGSIGRGFATPYSDLEFAILLKEDTHKDYFKTLSELFHIRIIALGESPIALFELDSMHWLKEENSPSSRGLMLDPWNIVPYVPLGGAFELIGTPRHLASILSPSETKLEQIKKCMFYTFTFILGQQSLVDAYQEEVDLVLALPQEYRGQLAEKMLWSDLDRYYTNLGNWLAQGPIYSLKHDFYRPFTNLLDALTLKEGLHASSPWDQINKLYERKLINEENRDSLHKAVDEIGLVRLKAFILYGKQKNVIYPTGIDLNADNTVKYIEEESKLEQLIKTLIPIQQTVRKQKRQ